MEGCARNAFALQPLDTALAQRLDTCMHARPRGDGNYLPGLASLRKLLELSASHLCDAAVTNVLFLSDGRPSDWELPAQGARGAGQLTSTVTGALRDQMQQLMSTAPRVRVKFLAFGNADNAEFEVLRAMAAALPGEAGEFLACTGATTAELGRTVSEFSSRVATSRLSSVSALVHDRRRLRPVRNFNAALAQRYAAHHATIFRAPPAGEFDSDLEWAGEFEVRISVGLMPDGTGGERNVHAYNLGLRCVARELMRNEPSPVASAPDAQRATRSFRCTT